MKEEDEKASSFLVKLLNMLRSKENAKTITWDVTEKGIRILNQQKLEEMLLPKYFRHHKFSSFVRQLNMYDFHKVYMPDNTSMFYHEIFNPREYLIVELSKESIYRIKRKATVNDENIQITNKHKHKPEVHTNFYPPKIEEPNAKSSFKLLFKNETANLEEKCSKEKNKELILEEIIIQVTPFKISKELVKEKISELRKFPKFKKFLNKHSFMTQVYLKLGIDMESEDDKLSVLSIEEELLFDTKKPLTLKSMQMFDSGPINLKDTIGMLLN